MASLSFVVRAFKLVPLIIQGRKQNVRVRSCLLTYAGRPHVSHRNTWRNMAGDKVRLGHNSGLPLEIAEITAMRPAIYA